MGSVEMQGNHWIIWGVLNLLQVL